MSDDRNREAPPFSLKRWSQRKLEASRAARGATPSEIPSEAPKAQPAAPVAATAREAPAVADETVLPPVESLDFESDFVAFMQPKVAETVKRAALKKLFRDPRFNVMDGLDVYIDDYSIPSPIEPEVVRQLVQARYIFDPPKTRVNAQGWVEDVPPDEIEPEAASDAPAVPESDSTARVEHPAPATLPTAAGESAAPLAAPSSERFDETPPPDSSQSSS